MESRVAIYGHPLHAMLIVFPVALFLTSLIFDLAYWGRRDPFWQRSAFWLIVVGEIGTVAAAIPGLIDFVVLPLPPHVRAIATLHLIIGLFIAGVYAVQLALRRPHRTARDIAQPYSLPLVVLIVVGVLAVMAQGLIGGQIAHVHRIGVVPEHVHRHAPAEGEAPEAAPGHVH